MHLPPGTGRMRQGLPPDPCAHEEADARGPTPILCESRHPNPGAPNPGPPNPGPPGLIPSDRRPRSLWEPLSSGLRNSRVIPGFSFLSIYSVQGCGFFSAKVNSLNLQAGKFLLSTISSPPFPSVFSFCDSWWVNTEFLAPTVSCCLCSFYLKVSCSCLFVLFLEAPLGSVTQLFFSALSLAVMHLHTSFPHTLSRPPCC